MAKKKHENFTNREYFKALSGWILISTILSLLVKSTSAATLFSLPENIKEQFIGNTLVRGLHSYFPSFSIASYEQENAFCVLLPPDKICQHLVWFLQDFYGHDGATTAAKKICGTYVEKIFNILIDAGATYIDLVWHNNYFYPNVIPLNTTTAYGFCSNRGAEIMCSSAFPVPNKTTVDFIMQQSDLIYDSLIEISLTSVFKKFIIGLLALGFTLALMNRNKISEALQNFSIHRNQTINTRTQVNINIDDNASHHTTLKK